MPPPEDPFARAALLAAPSGFLHLHRVRFQEVDAAGIVFFARLFEYFHDGYFAFLESNGIRLDEVLREGPWVAPLIHAEADFLRPLRFGDVITVGPVRAAWAGGRLTIAHRAQHEGSGEAVALGRTVHAFVDRNFQKIEPPAEMLRAFLPLVG